MSIPSGKKSEIPKMLSKNELTEVVTLLWDMDTLGHDGDLEGFKEENYAAWEKIFKKNEINRKRRYISIWAVSVIFLSFLSALAALSFGQNSDSSDGIDRVGSNEPILSINDSENSIIKEYEYRLENAQAEADCYASEAVFLANELYEVSYETDQLRGQIASTREQLTEKESELAKLSAVKSGQTERKPVNPPVILEELGNDWNLIWVEEEKRGFVAHLKHARYLYVDENLYGILSNLDKAFEVVEDLHRFERAPTEEKIKSAESEDSEILKKITSGQEIMINRQFSLVDYESRTRLYAECYLVDETSKTFWIGLITKSNRPNIDLKGDRQ